MAGQRAAGGGQADWVVPPSWRGPNSDAVSICCAIQINGRNAAARGRPRPVSERHQARELIAAEGVLPIEHSAGTLKRLVGSAARGRRIEHPRAAGGAAEGPDRGPEPDPPEAAGEEPRRSGGTERRPASDALRLHGWRGRHSRDRRAGRRHPARGHRTPGGTGDGQAGTFAAHGRDRRRPSRNLRRPRAGAPRAPGGTGHGRTKPSPPAGGTAGRRERHGHRSRPAGTAGAAGPSEPGPHRPHRGRPRDPYPAVDSGSRFGNQGKLVGFMTRSSRGGRNLAPTAVQVQSTAQERADPASGYAWTTRQGLTGSRQRR